MSAQCDLNGMAVGVWMMQYASGPVSRFFRARVGRVLVVLLWVGSSQGFAKLFFVREHRGGNFALGNKSEEEAREKHCRVSSQQQRRRRQRRRRRWLSQPGSAGSAGTCACT